MSKARASLDLKSPVEARQRECCLASKKNSDRRPPRTGHDGLNQKQVDQSISPLINFWHATFLLREHNHLLVFEVHLIGLERSSLGTPSQCADTSRPNSIALTQLTLRMTKVPDHLETVND